MDIERVANAMAAARREINVVFNEENFQQPPAMGTEVNELSQRATPISGPLTARPFCVPVPQSMAIIMSVDRRLCGAVNRLRCVAAARVRRGAFRPDDAL